MAGPDFLFALKLSGDAGFDDMLADLAGSVLRHAGYAAAVIAEIGDELRTGVARRLEDGACDVRFSAHNGEFEITVSQGGQDLVRMSRALPE